MSKILIVGAGQAGLQLALGLVQDGHEVTVVSNRAPDDIRNGRVMSSQCMFDAALQTERDLDLAFWEDECPPIEGISLAVPAPDGSGKAIDWASRLDAYAQAVDQRLKMPGWMEELERRGADVVIHEAGVDDLERYTQENDLVIVAAGKGEIVRLFERNPERSPYDQPMRALALTYVTGMTPRPEYSAVCFNLIPTVGEYFVFPALTTTGVCEIMVFEGVPGGPMDCWGDVTTPQEHLDNPRYGVGGRRLRGYRRAFADRSLRLRSERLIPTPVTLHGGDEAFSAAWEGGTRPTAVLAVSDIIAMGALRAARRLGVRVPEDLEVIGFDDIPLAAASQPPLSTVHQPIPEKGRVAIRLLIRELDEGGPRERIVLPTDLVLRESTKGGSESGSKRSLTRAAENLAAS